MEAICRRLDSLPLAIELAAARRGSMSVADLERRLDDRFRVLKGGSHDASPRQQPLTATIEWSVALLTPDEAGLFASLGVFLGGWTLDAIEAIRFSAHPASDDVDTLLSSLVEKCLMQLDLIDSEGRYFLLESLAEYGRARLDHHDPNVVARLRYGHLCYYVELVETLYIRRLRKERQYTVRHLRVEIENLYTALEWSIRERLPELGLRIVKSVGWSHVRDDRRFAETVERLIDIAEGCDAALVARAHLQCSFHHTLSSAEIREHHADRAVELAKQSGEHWYIACALEERAFHTFLAGEGEAALPLLHEATRVDRRSHRDGRRSARATRRGERRDGPVPAHHEHESERLPGTHANLTRTSG